MKSKFGLGLIASVSIVSVMLASCTSSVAPPEKVKKVKDYVISVQAKSNPKILDIDPVGDAKCKNSNGQDNGKFGCIDVGIDEQAESVFNLTPASWHMTEIKICDGATKDPQNCSLSAAGQKEFAIMVEDDLNRYFPNQDGLIEFSDIPGEISEFKLLDFNNIHAPKDYFYTLRACKNNDSTNCADTDPMIKNGGRQ